MESASRQAHWENVYTTKDENEVSWFQQSPAPSFELITQAGATHASAIIDIGGGASRLVDHLVEQGFEDVTVLDLSGAALEAAKRRLERRADRVHWVVADATAWEPVKDRALWPSWAIAIASSAIEIRSPAVRSMSSSRGGGSGVTCSARSRSSSVVSPIAETTTTTSCPALRVPTMR